jgi:hypothetical protein
MNYSRHPKFRVGIYIHSTFSVPVTTRTKENIMTYRIDNSFNDAPYQGIHIFKDDVHVLTFWEDDAPVHDFNAEQHVRARELVSALNDMSVDQSELILCSFRYATHIPAHKRIKLNPCKCVDCGGDQPTHSSDCTEMASLHGES